MEHITLLIGIVIVTALVFDFTNGFHDTANAMATTISTGAMKPKAAVAMSAILNLAGAFISVEVAKTISKGLIDESVGIQPEVIFAALVGAITWNMLTWLAGLPSSSSHALMGGLLGAAVASMGIGAVNGDVVVTKVLIPALAAPLVAGLAAVGATKLTYRLTRNADQEQVGKGYRAGQITSAALVSLAHGTNDAQKTMGVITLALISGGILAPDAGPPMWVIVSAGLAIALGTYLGGWRIIRTLGRGITDIHPPQGFAAQTSAAVTILASSHLGFSLSTTHTCSGAVMGAGLGRKGGVVRWGTAGRMLAAWGITVPAAGLVAGGAALLAEQGDWGVAVVALVGLGVSGAIWVASRRQKVDHTNVNDDPVAPAGRTGTDGEDGEHTEDGAGVVTAAMQAVAPPPVSASVPHQHSGSHDEQVDQHGYGGHDGPDADGSGPAGSGDGAAPKAEPATASASASAASTSTTTASGV